MTKSIICSKDKKFVNVDLKYYRCDLDSCRFTWIIEIEGDVDMFWMCCTIEVVRGRVKCSKETTPKYLPVTF